MGSYLRIRSPLAAGMVMLAWAAGAAQGGKPHPPKAAEAHFLADNDAAMTKMMSGMKVNATGDVDADFVAMMTPHHQGAIDMAEAELRYGRNEQLRRMAQEIIVDQQQEITAMHLALGQPLPPSSPAPTQPAIGLSTSAEPASQRRTSSPMTVP